MKILLLIILSIFILNSGDSQTPKANLEKYWLYRYRLTNDFLVIGSGQGQSIPAAIRSPYLTNSIGWGDATIDLGWYIGVLATEFKLLKDNNQNTLNTAKELYYALEAFNRLDVYAEVHWGGNPSLNGFFVRDDVFRNNSSDNFVMSNNHHFNRSKPNNPMTDVHTNNPDDPNPPPRIFEEESIDQAIHMLLGLTLVAKLLHVNDSYGLQFYDGEIYFVKEAKKITERIVNWMKTNGWKIKNPAILTGNNCVKGNQDGIRSCAVGTGGNAQIFSYALARTTCFLHHSNWNNYFHRYTCNYQNVESLSMEFIWNYLAKIRCRTYIPPPGDLIGNWLADKQCQYCSQMQMVMILAATGKSYGNSTLSNLTEQSIEANYEILPLVYRVLHPEEEPAPAATEVLRFHYINLLNSAPCSGPYNISNAGIPNYPNYEWSTPNRMRQPEKRGVVQDEPCAHFFAGYYPGLDYMLLHNLYYIIYKNQLPPFINNTSTNVNIPLPYHLPFTWIGTDSNPLRVRSLFINAFSNINSNGNAEFKAFREVKFMPGFYAQNGSFVHAWIQNCP